MQVQKAILFFFWLPGHFPALRPQPPPARKSTNRFTLTPLLTRERSTNLIPNYWAQPSPALPAEEVKGMGWS